MPTPLREQVIAALADRLATLTGVRVERNRDREIEPSMMPMLVIVDGGQSVDEGNSGIRRYVLRLAIEGYVAAATPAGLGLALSDLYARTVELLLADHTLGGIAVDLREGDLADPVIDREPGHRPIAGFELSIEVEYWTAPGDLTAPAP
jgi:hypothetical protein